MARPRVKKQYEDLNWAQKMVYDLWRQSGYDQKTFAIIVGVKYRTLQDYILGNTEPKVSTLDSMKANYTIFCEKMQRYLDNVKEE